MSCPEISTYRNLKKFYPLNLMRCSDTYTREAGLEGYCWTT